MNILRGLWVAMFIGIVIFTFTAASDFGWNLGKPFVENLIAMNWSGQFNFDFLCYLWLSAIWIAWRHHFTLTGIVIAVLASVLGILFFAPYLMLASIQSKGDHKVLLLGKKRAY